KVFQQYLLSDERQRALMNTGMRPADSRTQLASPIDRTNGANPDAKISSASLPDLLVIDRIIEVWHRVKKHAVIVMLFDKSGSMQGSKITAAVKGAQEFIRRMDRDDRIIWMPFDSTIYSPVEGSGSEVGENLIRSIAGTSAGGGTSLYDAIL